MWYSSGTVSATNDSNVITGSGTAFLANVRIGDGITIQGSQSLHEVIGIASNTQLTIKPAFTGTSGSGKQFACAPILGYDKDLSDAFNQLRLQFGDQLSNLQPWATAPTQDAAQTALGLGTAATANVQTSPTDTAAGALMAVGAFGLGGGGPSLDTTEVFQPPGEYSGETSITGVPDGVGGRALQKFIGTATYGAQLLFNANATDINATEGVWFRHWRGGSPVGGFKRLVHSGNILGTVSQSGGVPTGAIIERGSNANGEYVRFADGTQICLVSSLPIDINIAAGSLFRGLVTWAFPASFIGSTPVFGSSIATGGHSEWGANTTGTGVNSTILRAMSVTSRTGSTIDGFAIGRWQ